MTSGINQFNKIRLLDDIANQIGWYGVQCGNEKLMDYIDMNCGGIPDGEYTQVVDPDAPEQFLKMYTITAETRFAFAVTALLKMNTGYMNALEEFCTRIGREMQVPPVSNIQEAQEVANSFCLGGIPDDEAKPVIQAAWKKAGGELSVYYHLLECFVNGLLQTSKIFLTVDKDGKFIFNN